jgi:predicted acylesterase/phospholipase RssA
MSVAGWAGARGGPDGADGDSLLVGGGVTHSLMWSMTNPLVDAGWTANNDRPPRALRPALSFTRGGSMANATKKKTTAKSVNGVQTRPKQRAIALAGGGPAAGLHIGALAALEEAGIEFDVFSLSCVGAWVGIVYNTRPGPHRAVQTYDFFATHCFRDDASYAWFPVNRGFSSDLQTLLRAWMEFPFSPQRKWGDWILPQQIGAGLLNSLALWSRGRLPTDQELNNWLLNDVMAVNPATRFLISLIYQSQVNGLTKIYYDHSEVLEEVFRGRTLYEEGKPVIYHNAWRMAKGERKGDMQIFHNRPAQDQEGGYMEISKRSLCACSALPFIEESVEINGDVYTEGALVDTVNFAHLLRDHPGLDEVWINRIVGEKQVKAPNNLCDSLGNLPMQFAAEVGENDIKLFRQHLLNQTSMRPRVVEIPMLDTTKVNFDWSHANLRQGFNEGKEAVNRLLEFDPELRVSEVAEGPSAPAARLRSPNAGRSGRGQGQRAKAR